MSTTIIAPSILSADFSNLKSDIEMINNSEADWFHVDVMDGRFVPNITVGLPVVKALAGITQLPIDAHLMIVEPGHYADKFAKAGAHPVNDARALDDIFDDPARGVDRGVG